ncbi:MAG: hypothetical protein ACRDV0_04365, partial [Acidimicrobiales bacterium]
VATSVIPLSYVNAPAWSLSGVSDQSLITGDTAEHFAPVWVAISRLLRCAPRGASVATSEIGYLGFLRQDLTLIDLRGITNSTIAKTAPESTKTEVGVLDENWFSTQSVVGREIVLTRPDLVVEVDNVQLGTVLGGRYRLVKILNSSTTIGVYARRGWTTSCSNQLS